VPPLRILILKPSSLGDVVQALPVLRLLKRQFPVASVYWWVSTDLLPLLEGDPDLAGLFPFDRRGWGSLRVWRQTFASVRQMRRLEFDWIIDLQGLARSGIVAWLAKGQLTIGLDDAREGAPGFYDVAVPRPTPTTHAVDWYLQVLTVLGVPIDKPFDWLPPKSTVADRVSRQWPDLGSQWVALHPGARWPTKRWPVTAYAELVGRLAAQHPHRRFVLLGGAADVPLGAAITAQNPGCCLNLIGQTSLPEMVEWIRRSAVMVTNDTGPMHVAAALGGPVVALFGPTDPNRTGPYGQIDQVIRQPPPCAPCLRAVCYWPQPMECLTRITPETVAAIIEQRLALPMPATVRAGGV